MNSVKDQPRSVSQTQQWEECGHRWYLARIERVIPRPAAWSHHGVAFHAAAEAVERSGRSMDAEEAVQIFSDQYSAGINRSLDQEPDTNRWLSAGPYDGAQDIERRYALGQEQTARYVQWAREHQPDIWKTPEGKPALELYFLVELGGVQVRGYIDQLLNEGTGAVRVRDLKTGSTRSKFQLQTYGLAMEQLYGVTVNRGDWYMGKTGGLSRPVRLDQLDGDEVGERYATMDAAVRRGDHPASPGFNCRFCDVSHACEYRA